jgi:predicted outer membrane protein
VGVGHTEMGNLAQTRAKSDKVKGFGEKMAKDFVRLDQQFIDYAKDHDIVLSDATGMFKGTVKGDVKNRDAKFEKLGKLQGEAFDRAFLTATVEGCEKFIPVLEASKGKYEDASFDRVLDKAINTLKGYQKEAQTITEKDYAPAS